MRFQDRADESAILEQKRRRDEQKGINLFCVNKVVMFFMFVIRLLHQL